MEVTPAPKKRPTVIKINQAPTPTFFAKFGANLLASEMTLNWITSDSYRQNEVTLQSDAIEKGSQMVQVGWSIYLSGGLKAQTKAT